MKRKGFLVVLSVGAILILLPLIPVLSLQAISQEVWSRLGPGSYQIEMVSRQFTPAQGIASADRLALEGLARQARAAGRSRIHALVQLDTIPTREGQQALASQGLTLLEYISNYAWIAAIPADDPARVAGLPGVRWVGELTAADKTDAALDLESSPWAYDAASGQAALYVMLHKDVSAEAGAALLAGRGQVKSYASAANLYVLWVDRGQAAALLNEDLVSWVQPAAPAWEAQNGATRPWIHSDVLAGSTYGYADGTNVDVLVYDVAQVRTTQQKLYDRVTIRDTACPSTLSLANHATHVACTLSANGGSPILYTGMASETHALLSDCMSTNTGAYYYTDPAELQGDLAYARGTWNPTGGDADGAELWNASVGTNVAYRGWPCVWEGNYGPTDAIVDRVVRGDVITGSAKFVGIWSIGDERGGTGRCGISYHTAPPPACGKNAIQVGATYNDADTMTPFSSWGPCDDGRVKPVVTAPGAATDGGIWSCGAANDTTYIRLSGTSMAAPATAGVVAQLIEYCRAQGLTYCPTDGEFWPSSARALLMHAAVDLGNTGPDYQFGYGRIRADASADLLTNSAPNYPDLRQDTVSNQGEIDSYQITVSGSPARLTVTLAWDDAAATMQALKKLVNNLDLEVVSPGGTTYRPYILDPNNPANAATTGVDSVNNQEQVVVSSPANGAWTIRVSGKTVPAAPQGYSIIFPNAYNIAPTQTPGATPTITPTPDPGYCAEYISNGSFENGTAGWTLLDSAARSNLYATDGTYSLRAGGTWDGAYYQDVLVPGDMYTGTIRFSYRMQTTETLHPRDFFEVEVRDPATGQALTTLLSTDDTKANGVWTEAAFAIGTDYAGRPIRLHFSADVTGTIDTYWYVDQVRVNLCRHTPTATPTSSPGPSPTPAPTPTLLPTEAAGEQAPACMDDPADILAGPGPVIAAPEAAGIAAPPAGPPEVAAQPQAVGAITNIKVEGLTGNSGWVSADADRQGNLYVAFEHPYTTGGSCPTGGCVEVYAGSSRDNGRTWNLRTVWAGTGSSSARDPSITVDSNGKLYVAMELYTNGRWRPARATSTCPRDISAWDVISYTTTYALVQGATAADAGGDGDDVYMVFQVACDTSPNTDLYTLYTVDGGSSWKQSCLPIDATYNWIRPTVSVGNLRVVYTVQKDSSTGIPPYVRSFYYGAIGKGPQNLMVTNVGRAFYADADASGPYHYLVYQRYQGVDDNIYIMYSTNDGASFSTETAVDATANYYQQYPDVAAHGRKVRVAYIDNVNQTRLQMSEDNGANWLGTPYTLNTGTGTTTASGFHYAGLAFHPVGGPADGKHPMAFWVDNRDGAADYNIYMGGINDPPPVPTLSWPGSGATITAFAPSLAWSAGGSDPDGDTLRYAWYISTTGSPSTGDKVGGPISSTSALPYYTAPATTYYWKVVADDGYQTSADSAVRSFTTANETMAGTPLNYTQAFTTNPDTWTRKGFACLDCFETAPLRWSASPSGKWVRSSSYAYSGSYSAQALYDANNADYRMTSPALDLRGTSWAFFNTRFRGSSESGADYLYLESRPSSAAACWTREDARSGDYNSRWQHFLEGSVDLSAFGNTATGQMRFRFVTNGANFGGGYGVGWFEDEVEVARQSEWSWQSTSPYFYRLQTSQGGWFGYTNNLVDQFYSPYVLLPNSVGRAIRLILREQYNVASGDAATIWIRDVAAGAWQQLTAYNGYRGSWTDRTVLVPDSYKGKQVVVALVLRSDSSGTKRIQEAGGYWSVDRFRLEEYTPTAVSLVSFAAWPSPYGVLLTWETASEHNNVGFNLYRSASPETVGEQLNQALIPSASPGGDVGASYVFTDTTALARVTYYYTLEDVDVENVRTPHGPIEFTLWRVYLPLVP